MAAWALGLPGCAVASFGLPWSFDPDRGHLLLGLILELLGFVAFVAGMACLLRRKSRHWAWAIPLTLGGFTILAFFFLSKRCWACGRSDSSAASACSACGAPM